MVGRACSYQRPDGRRCRATPMRDEPFCFWHAPETAEDAAEARRLGGLHRRKKRTVSAIYGFGGLRTPDDQLALLETTVIETMALENSIARNRAVANMVSIASRLREASELEERIEALELATASSQRDRGTGGRDGGLLGE